MRRARRGRRGSATLALAFAALGSLFLPRSASAQSSAYTDLRAERCRAVEVGTSHCPGPFGHVLQVDGVGASDMLILLWPRRGGSGGRATVEPPSGPASLDGVSAIGDRAEWRVENGRVIGLVVRRNREGGKSVLESYKIDGRRLCWIANVEGPEQNAQARRLVDTHRDLPCPRPEGRDPQAHPAP